MWHFLVSYTGIKSWVGKKATSSKLHEGFDTQKKPVCIPDKEGVSDSGVDATNRAKRFIMIWRNQGSWGSRVGRKKIGLCPQKLFSWARNLEVVKGTSTQVSSKSEAGFVSLGPGRSMGRNPIQGGRAPKNCHRNWGITAALTDNGLEYHP